MLTIAICDDNLEFAKQFKHHLLCAFDKKEIKCKIKLFNNAEALLKILETTYFDIICLDIEIGEQNGIDIGNTIRDMQGNQRSQIVFISSYPSYHESGSLYSSAPMAFIKKPFNDHDIRNIVSKTITRILQHHNEDRFFLFEYKKCKYSILKRDIIYIECQLRTKIIYTLNATYHLISNTKDIISALNDSNFVLIHRAYLVNVNQIGTINRSEAICRTGQRLPVSATFYKDARWAVEQAWERQKQKEEQYV